MELNNFSGKDNIKKLQEILSERSKLQAVINHEEKEKSQLQFRLIDLDKILKELVISITQKKFIVDEYDQLILKTESTLKKMSDDLESLFNLLKTALSVELEPPKIYKIDTHKPNTVQNFSKQKGRNVSSIMADYENATPCEHSQFRKFRPANGL